MNLRDSSLRKAAQSVAKLGFRAGFADVVARWARSRTSVPRDVAAEYQWVLRVNQPPLLPPPKLGPLKINWILQGVGRGSGGLSNIFRTIHALEKWGHTNRIYVLDENSPIGIRAQQLIRDFYFPIEGSIEVLREKTLDSDALIATNWVTAYAVRSVPNTAGKFYFVQDLENRFYADGSLAEFAKETYRWGFHGITLGQWIADELQRGFGMRCSPFGFSYDRKIYSFERQQVVHSQKRKRILFYARPLTERRGFELGMLALSLVARKHPDAEFILVGFPSWGMRVPFRAVFPGLLTPSELASLYHGCDAAMVLSHTNLSMLPLELMACGCPVICNRGPNVEWILKDETAQLADPTPQSLAQAVLDLLENDLLRERKISAGLAFAQGTDWTLEIKKVEDALYGQLGSSRAGHDAQAMAFAEGND